MRGIRLLERARWFSSAASGRGGSKRHGRRMQMKIQLRALDGKRATHAKDAKRVATASAHLSYFSRGTLPQGVRRALLGDLEKVKAPKGALPRASRHIGPRNL